MRKRYRTKQLNGQCYQCPNIARENKTTCTKCGEASSKSNKLLRKHRITSGLCQSCSNPAISGTTFCAVHRDKRKAYSRANKCKLKTEVFVQYGGATCICCGEDEVFVLALDHVNDDGATERRKLLGENQVSGTGTGNEFYRYLKRMQFPNKDKYRVLCMNCNFYAHQFPGQKCFHKLRSIHV